MSETAEETPTTGSVKRTISLPPEVAKMGDEGAARESRNFSNFMAFLIQKDAAEVKRESGEAVAA